MPAAYLYLCIAILFEVIATTSLKAADGFTNLVPSIVVGIGYSASFYFLGLALKHIPVGIAYAVWAGLGIVLIAVAAAVIYRQIPDAATLIGMVLIIAGVMAIHLFSKTNAS